MSERMAPESSGSVALEQRYATLAGPFAGSRSTRVRLLDVATYGHVSGLFTRFVAQHARVLDERCPELPNVLLGALRREPSFDSLWSPAISTLVATMRDDKLDPVRAAAEAAIDLGLRGLPGAWSASFEAPSAVRFGRFMVLDAVAIQVYQVEGRLAVRVDSAHELISTCSGVESAGDGRVKVLPVTRDGCFTVLRPSTIRYGCELAPDLKAHAAEPDDLDSFVAALTSAIAVLADAGEAYSDWVRPAVREVIALRSDGSVMRSGSASHWPGMIYMSVADPLVMAENLLHEACHQYVWLASRIEPIVEADHADEYYSPFVGRQRPLEAILLAYHAFGNARLFLQSCANISGVSSRRLYERSQYLDAGLRTCEAYLVQNPGLTALGRAIVAPIQTALGELELDRARLEPPRVGRVLFAAPESSDK